MRLKKTRKRFFAIILGVIIVIALLITASILANRDTINSPSHLLSLGERYLLEMDFEQALVHFLQVIEIDPMNPRGYTGAAEAYLGLERPDDAIVILQQGLIILPDNHAIQAMLYELLGSAEISQIENAITNDTTLDAEVVADTSGELDFTLGTWFEEAIIPLPVRPGERGYARITGNITFDAENNFARSGHLESAHENPVITEINESGRWTHDAENSLFHFGRLIYYLEIIDDTTMRMTLTENPLADGQHPITQITLSRTEITASEAGWTQSQSTSGSAPTGLGTAESPFLVATAEHLEWINAQWGEIGGANIERRLGGHWIGRHFLVVSDIVAPSNFVLGNEGRVRAFQGVFDGGGHTITVSVDSQDINWPAGLFSEIGRNGAVRNINIAGNVTGASDSLRPNGFAGGLVAINSGTIENVNVSANVSGRDVGGIVANNDGLISHSRFDGIATGSLEVGGIVMSNGSRGIIEYSSFLGVVIETGELPYPEVGNNAGGVAARNAGIIRETISTGSVSGTGYVGQVVGYERGR